MKPHDETLGQESSSDQMTSSNGLSAGDSGEKIPNEELTGLLPDSLNVVRIANSRKDGGRKKGENPVDSGYAWVVMIASFGIQFLLIGYIKSMGVLFVELQSRFHSTSAETSLIVGTMEMTGTVFSPLVMVFLLKRASPRTCCLIGSVFLVVGVAGNAWFSKIELLCLTQGVIFGIAIGLQFGTPFVALTQYFDKRRALATSISTCGASMGGVVFPLIFRRLLDEYAFEGGVLMMAGVQMHAFIFSALLVPIQNHSRRRRDQFKGSLIEMEPMERGNSEKYPNINYVECGNIPIKSCEPCEEEGMKENLNILQEMVVTYEQKGISEYCLTSTKTSPGASDSKNRKGSCASCLNKGSLLRSFTFWLLCGFYLFASMGSAVPQTFIPALAEERGLTKDEGAFLLSILNILDIPAHLIPGAIVNFWKIRPTRMSVLPMLIVGIVSNLTPFFNSYSTMLTMSILYGLFMGTYLVMQSLITIELLGAENFPRAMGIYYGITSLGPAISYPICGALKDMSQSYMMSFHYLGTAAILATLILIVAPVVRKHELRREALQTSKGDNSANI
ncbi:hypothetical protein Btru_020079 [Bulinus truncatus]|nr:hypothetical protein Btru_020079 [Bulinus truncatus]